MNDTDVPFCVICHRVCDDSELNEENECVKCVGPACGPTPEGKVTIFEQEAFFCHVGDVFDTKASWEAELFPFRGVILLKKSGYEWRLNLHSSFHSRGSLGRGMEKEFDDSKSELEDCSKEYFKSMRWFTEKL